MWLCMVKRCIAVITWGVLSFDASFFDNKVCMLSYFQRTVNLYCNTSCILTTLNISKLHFYSIVPWKDVKCEGWIPFYCWDIVDPTLLQIKIGKLCTMPARYWSNFLVKLPQNGPSSNNFWFAPVDTEQPVPQPNQSQLTNSPEY